jgi:hypothetical protein
MKTLRCALHVAAALAVSVAVISASDQAPAGPFEVIHYFQINVPRADAERIMIPAVTALNKGIAKGGCAECVYRLWRVSGEAPWGIAEYQLTSSWPSREVYERVLASQEFRSVLPYLEKLRTVTKSEGYVRYVEVK